MSRPAWRGPRTGAAGLFLLAALCLSAGAARAQESADRLTALVQALSGAQAGERAAAEESLLAYGLDPRLRAQLQAVDSAGGPAALAARRLLNHPALDAAQPRVLLVTNKGELEAVLFAAAAPRTTANFIALAQRRFYDGLSFHRNVKGHFIQGGDPTNTGQGGPGYGIPDEINAEALGLDRKTAAELNLQLGLPEPPKAVGRLTLKEIYRRQGYLFAENLPSRPFLRGTLGMAFGGQRANGSQFFICQIACPALDGRHTAFGQVVRGWEVLDRLAAAPVGANERPLELLEIRSVRLLPRPEPVEEARQTAGP